MGHGVTLTVPAQVVEYLAVDAYGSNMGDDQRTDKFVTQCLSVLRMLQVLIMTSVNIWLLAKKQDIPFKLDIYPFYGSDASAAMSAGAEMSVPFLVLVSV